MKKAIYALAFILICCSLFSCQNQKNKDTSSNPFNEVPGNITLRFDSYEKLYEALYDSSYYRNYPSEEYGESFSKFLYDIGSQKAELYYPAYNGEKIKLKSLNGNIVLLRSQEKFGLPWIVYYCNIDGNDIALEICYLNSIEKSGIDDKATYSDISSILAPSYPLANTFSDEDKNVFNSITEKEIELDCGINTIAAVFDYNEDNYWHRINYRFRYNDILVSVWNYHPESYDFISEELFRNFSLVKAS